MIKLLIDQLNEYPAFRLGVLILVFVLTGMWGTWVVSGYLRDIEVSLKFLQVGQDNASIERAENRTAIKLNTEFRLRSEGATQNR